MESELIERKNRIYKVVLTGGPCGGKTTGQARLSSFFEKLGWKVLRTPETASCLLGGGIKFSELNEEQGVRFQEDLLLTMLRIEDTFFHVAEALNRDVLIICDRGTMDASAFISQDQWDDILLRNGKNEVEMRDSRYHQVIHMVSAAHGAEKFYSLEGHSCRSEGVEVAKELDKRASNAWIGHPYLDMVDNSTDFETKLNRMIQTVCTRLGIDVRDRLEGNAKKVKFLIRGPLPADNAFPVEFRDFTVVHNYLRSSGINNGQCRLRMRGHQNQWTYSHTMRRQLHGQFVEVKTTLTSRDYTMLLNQADMNHYPVYKTRRCFLHNDQYFQMDIYQEPYHQRCDGLILLETYTTLDIKELLQRLPRFLNIQEEVTGNPEFSMFNLSLRGDWENNRHFSGLLSTLSINGSANGVGNGAESAKTKERSNENGNVFMNGNGCTKNGNGIATPIPSGSGKYKGYENGHGGGSNGIGATNGHGSGSNGIGASNGHTSVTSKALNGSSSNGH